MNSIDDIEKVVLLIQNTTDKEVRAPLIKLLWILIEKQGTITNPKVGM